MSHNKYTMNKVHFTHMSKVLKEDNVEDITKDERSAMNRFGVVIEYTQNRVKIITELTNFIK